VINVSHKNKVYTGLALLTRVLATGTNAMNLHFWQMDIKYLYFQATDTSDRGYT